MAASTAFVWGNAPKPKLTQMSSATMPPSTSARRARSGSWQQWQLALHLFGSMPKAKLAPDAVSFISVLEYIYNKCHVPVLFLQALYDSQRNEGSGLLDPHKLSPGAALLAVRLWLLEEIPSLLSSEGPTCTIIVGFGQSRPRWQESDNQAFIMNMPKSHGIPAKSQPDNPGTLKLKMQDLFAFRDRLSRQTSGFPIPGRPCGLSSLSKAGAFL